LREQFADIANTNEADEGECHLDSGSSGSAEEDSSRPFARILPKHILRWRKNGGSECRNLCPDRRQAWSFFGHVNPLSNNDGLRISYIQRGKKQCERNLGCRRGWCMWVTLVTDNFLTVALGFPRRDSLENVPTAKEIVWHWEYGSRIIPSPSRWDFRDPTSRFRLLAKHRCGSQVAQNLPQRRFCV
jgi:hypothetical protein